MNSITARAVVLASLLAFATTSQSDLPPLVVPEGLGVNIHFTRGSESDLDLIAAAGIKFVRMDLFWSHTERERGEYTWTEYDELISNLGQRGLRAILILDYSNGIYEEVVAKRDETSGKETGYVHAPRRPESVAAFARWAAAAARHFRSRGVIWEIWNEPNIHHWRPKPNARDYATLALAAAKAVRAADPEATIVAPGSAGFPWMFFQELFEAGLLDHLNAVTVHPYRADRHGPETVDKDYSRLRALIGHYTSAGRNPIPILNSEWGYSTNDPGGLPLETQAAFIARQYLVNLYHEVPISIWYDWKNDGRDRSELQHNFGIVTTGREPKPSYIATQTLTRQLSGFRIDRRLDVGRPDAWVLLCVNRAGDRKLAAWTTGQPAEATLDLEFLGVSPVAAVDGQGRPVPLRTDSAKLKLVLQPAPLYVTLQRR